MSRLAWLLAPAPLASFRGAEVERRAPHRQQLEGGRVECRHRLVQPRLCCFAGLNSEESVLSTLLLQPRSEEDAADERSDDAESDHAQ